MRIALMAVTFAHDGGSGRYTLPLRVNEVLSVNVPEWVRGMSAPSDAAYIRDRLPEAAFILARFAADAGGAAVVQIRALASDASTAKTGAGKLLPNLPPVQVAFWNGDSGWCVLPLDTSELRAGGVGCATTLWSWQFREAEGAQWVEFDESVHNTYVVLSLPTVPWSLAPALPANPALPWTEVLRVACEWASGSQDAVEAASRITTAVYGMGKGALTYDVAVGAPHYTVLGIPRFLCGAFLDRVRGGPGAGPLVNCSDCGTIVSTFANVLGADLWQSKMGFIAPGFKLNPILAIGSSEWSLRGGFAFHEVAWSGDCTERDTVFDACLETNADKDPSSAPETPNLPRNQIFGAVGEPGTYRDQLAAPSDRPLCAPFPPLRARRPVSGQYFSLGAPLPPQAERAVEQRLGLRGSVARFDFVNYFFAGFRFFGTEFPGWSLTRIEQYGSFGTIPRTEARFAGGSAQVAPGSRVSVSWWRSNARSDASLRVESFDTPSADEARRTLLRVAADIEFPTFEPSGNVGDVAVRTSNGALVLLVRGNLVHAVRSADVHVIDVTGQAEQLDQILTSSGTPYPLAVLSQRMTSPRGSVEPDAWIRIVSTGARARLDQGRVVVEPGAAADARIAVFAVTRAQANARFPHHG
jgi:hypothetical protein